MKSTNIHLLMIVLSASWTIYQSATICDARHRSSKNLDSSSKSCKFDECQLKPQHFMLYSTIKEALESNFDIKGKEIYPFLDAVELLRLRYDGSDASLKNSSRIIRELLDSSELKRALMIFQSQAGRSLTDLYRTPTNGNEQNLACNKLRIDDIERARKILDQDKELASVFANIQRNFAKKSAKKCLKKSCSSIDVVMSRIDSMVNRNNHEHSHRRHRPSSAFEDSRERYPRLSDSDDSKIIADLANREFGKQELELCRFFKKTNRTDCSISGYELSEIKISTSLVNELSEAYNNQETDAGSTSNNSNGKDKDANLKHMMESCQSFKAILDRNLYALMWYNKNELISKQKWSSRVNNCPKLSYWLQLNRVCSEMDAVSKGDSIMEKETIVY